jgi:hypothetical protein
MMNGRDCYFKSTSNALLTKGFCTQPQSWQDGRSIVGGDELREWVQWWRAPLAKIWID